MSLRIRLVLLILLLVAFVAVALSALEVETLVDSLSGDAIDRIELAGREASALLIDHVTRNAAELPTPQDFEETKALWLGIVSSDPEISDLLGKTMAPYPSILEINIAGESGPILASSNPANPGMPLNRRQEFKAWGDTRWFRRAFDLILRRQDWEGTVPIGPENQTQPVFIIQVVASPVLLRDKLLPELEKLGKISGGAILLCLALTLAGTNRVLRPLKRIEQTIDRIAQGTLVTEEPDGELAKEFRVVESKLNLLGQQFRGARADASELRQNVDQLLERMASQLDVATRLAAISRLTGGVAHEIKNPLNAILLRLDLLRARLGEPEEVLIGEIDILSKEVLRLNRVVKTFLDFSRPLEVSFEEVDLAALAREVTELITPQARLAGIATEFTGPAESLWMRGDPDLLKQAILNLATNAMDAMGSGGQLHVSAARAGDKLTLEV